MAFVKCSQVFSDSIVHSPLSDHCLYLIEFQFVLALLDEVVEPHGVEPTDSLWGLGYGR